MFSEPLFSVLMVCRMPLPRMQADETDSRNNFICFVVMVKPTTIRLSIGTEHIDDIIDDLKHGFEAVK